MSWTDPPHAGERWRRTNPDETRTVIDRTFGGDILYFSGRLPRRRIQDYEQRRCTEAEWHAWQLTAKRLP